MRIDILEFAQVFYPSNEFTQWQKDLLLKVQKAKEDNRILFVQSGRCIGRTMVMKIIDEFHNHN